MRAALVLIAVAACRREAAAPTEREERTRGGVIDSHVHLAYWPVGDELAAAGLAAVVDLGAPLPAVGGAQPLPVVWSGPMLTRPGGYPIDAWDPGGFGAGCADEACVTAAIAAAVARGARVVKVVAGADGLAPPLIAVAVRDAHARGLVVMAHALGAADAQIAADAGCDGLAHTPVEPLPPATVTAWRGRVVISTLAAFGGSPAAVANLRALHDGGAIVLYGTDLGNSRVAGVDDREVALLGEAGLSAAEIDDAMTTAPARYWRLDVTAARPPDPASASGHPSP